MRHRVTMSLHGYNLALKLITDYAQTRTGGSMHIMTYGTKS